MDKTTKALLFDKLSFSMRPCALRAEIRTLLIEHGGTFSREINDNMIRLTENKSFKQGVHIDFIYDSIKQGVLLKLADYTLPQYALKETSNSITVDAAKVVSARSKYEPEEDDAIIQYVAQKSCDYGQVGSVTGNMMWKQMERDKITLHSWQSMKNRYLKKLQHHTPEFQYEPLSVGLSKGKEIVPFAVVNNDMNKSNCVETKATKCETKKEINKTLNQESLTHRRKRKILSTKFKVFKDSPIDKSISDKPKRITSSTSSDHTIQSFSYVENMEISGTKESCNSDGETMKVTNKIISNGVTNLLMAVNDTNKKENTVNVETNYSIHNEEEENNKESHVKSVKNDKEIRNENTQEDILFNSQDSLITSSLDNISKFMTLQKVPSCDKVVENMPVSCDQISSSNEVATGNIIPNNNSQCPIEQSALSHATHIDSQESGQQTDVDICVSLTSNEQSMEYTPLSCPKHCSTVSKHETAGLHLLENPATRNLSFNNSDDEDSFDKLLFQNAANASPINNKNKNSKLENNDIHEKRNDDDIAYVLDRNSFECSKSSLEENLPQLKSNIPSKSDFLNPPMYCDCHKIKPILSMEKFNEMLEDDDLMQAISDQLLLESFAQEKGLTEDELLEIIAL